MPIVEIVPVRVVEIVPVRLGPLLVVEITPVLVVEIVPTLVVEMVPVFANAVADTAITNVAAQIVDLMFPIALLLCNVSQGLCGRLDDSPASLLQVDLPKKSRFAIDHFKGCAKTRPPSESFVKSLGTLDLE